MPTLGSHRECQNCYDIYDKSKSTASSDAIHLFCSEECEKADAEFLASGNKTMKDAEAENPELFQGIKTLLSNPGMPAFLSQKEIRSTPSTSSATDSIDVAEHNQDINKLLNLFNIKRPEGE